MPSINETKQGKIGNIGEEFFLNNATSYPIYNIVDVRKDEIYQIKDIDFKCISTTTNKEITIDVKAEKYLDYSRRITYELTSQGGTPGCHARSFADFFFVTSITNNNVKEAFWVNVTKLRDWMRLNYGEKVYVPHGVSPTKVEGDYLETLLKDDKGNTDRRLGLLINIDRLIRDGVASKA